MDVFLHVQATGIRGATICIFAVRRNHYVCLFLIEPFFVFRSYDGASDLSCCECYDPGTDEWSSITPLGIKRSCLGEYFINVITERDFSYLHSIRVNTLSAQTVTCHPPVTRKFRKRVVTGGGGWRDLRHMPNLFWREIDTPLSEASVSPRLSPTGG